MPIPILEKTPILAVVERRETRDLLRLALPATDYGIAFASRREARIQAAQRPPSLAILDLSASRSSGLELCRTMRTPYTGPIVVLGPDGDEEIRVAAFEAGADQYLPKPFSAVELWTRVQALLRRFPGKSAAPSRLRVGDLEIDVVQRRLYRAGAEVMLTATEFELLVQLAENPNHVVNSKVLLRKVWGAEDTDQQTLRVHIAHLRKKIEPDPASPRYILTVQGVGYRLASAPESKKAKAAGAS
jgi:two-component system KDP operon response regulator KdpE